MHGALPPLQLAKKKDGLRRPFILVLDAAEIHRSY
jgi:hypothetical protein